MYHHNMHDEHEDVFHLGIKGLVQNGPGRILLLKVNPKHLAGADYWDLPGGRVQKGDSVEITLRRELQEELGVDEVHSIKPLGMVLSIIRIPVGQGDVGLILSVYTCDLGEDAELKMSDEHIDMQWFDKEQAADLLRVKYPPEFCELIRNL